VNVMGFQPSILLLIVPELGLVILAALVLALDLISPKREQTYLGWVTAAGLLLLAVLAAVVSRPGDQAQQILGGMLRCDWATFTFRLIFLFGAAITVLLGCDERSLKRCGEFCVLILVATLGMSLMAASSNLIMLYLAIETTSLPLYILAGFRVYDQKSVEAGLKYLLYGAMTSAVMLYGFSLLWGFTGTTDIYQIADKVQQGSLSPLVMGGTAMLVLVGFGFKVSAVPFHFWAPDVYEGALVRVLMAVFPASASFWTLVVAILAAASMIIGNILALTQRNIKRLLAYSSIAQAGYILIGVAAHSPLGAAGMVYYLASYAVTNLAAFGVVWLVGREVGSDDLDAYAGLGKRNPTVALALLVSLLSLGGIPPLSGFFGKLLVFGAAVQAGMIWLAVVGILTSIVGLTYYLTVMKIIYRPGADERPLVVNPSWRVALLVCVAGILILGTIFAPMYGLSVAAAGGWF
jgi:NADH-quinone oxidoreductase subunit N